MEENKEKTTDELLKENNELLKTLIGKLGVIRTAARIFVIGVIVSIIIYIFASVASCHTRNESHNSGTESNYMDSIEIVDPVY